MADGHNNYNPIIDLGELEELQKLIEAAPFPEEETPEEKVSVEKVSEGKTEAESSENPAEASETRAEEETQAETEGAEVQRKIESYVRMNEEKTEAWLYLARPDRDRKYTKDEVLAFLNENGVKAGYIMSNIIAMVKKGVYERAIKIAVIEPVLEGRDGYFEFSFDDSVFGKNPPRIREDGSVDYSSVNLLAEVKEGEWVARYHERVMGKPGHYVDGTVINPQPVKDLPSLKGKGFYFDDARGEYVAKISGKVDKRSDYEIHIEDVYEIKGDLNQLNSNVFFQGDVIVTGNVESQTTIRAERNIIINGTVEACEIVAGGDVVLKRGIQGGNKARVIAGGTVYADFLEHTYVNCDGDVHSNIILNSEIYSKGKIFLSGKRGAIVGGYTHGRKGIDAVNIGNTVEIKTLVHVGLLPEDFTRNQQYMEKDNELREQLLEVVKALLAVVKQSKIRTLTDREKREMVFLTNEKARLLEEQEMNKEEGKRIEALMQETTGATINVRGNTYQGTAIMIDGQTFLVKESLSYTTFRNASGTMENSTYAG